MSIHMHNSKSEINVYLSLIYSAIYILSYNNSLCCHRIILVDDKVDKSPKKFEARILWG